MLKKTESYILGIAIPIGAGLLSAFLTKDNMNIYQSIVKPASAPPAILFPIVWTALYVLMGIGSAMIYNAAAEQGEKRGALLLYGLQLAVNFFWSIIFFNKRAFLLSFVWLLLLLSLIVMMTASFRKISKTAAWLQIPYIIWVSFAGYLNIMIYILNR